MDEMNKFPEEDNEELKKQENPTPECEDINEPVSEPIEEAIEPVVEIPVPKAPKAKLPFIIGGMVAGVTAIAVSVALILGGGNGNQGGGNTPEDNGHEHSYSEWTIVDEPTCTEAGVEKRTCECGEKETRPVAAFGHIEVVDSEVNPTCTSTGLTEGKHCSKCSAVIIAQETIPMLSHIYDDKFDEDCNVCGHKRDADCAHVETIVVSGKAATCTATGLTDGTKCKKCGEIIVAQTAIPVVAHTETSVAAVEATCTGTGLTAGTKCSICNKTLVAQQETPKVAHTYDDKYDENCNICGFIRNAECAHRETETIYGYASSCTAAGLSDGTKCKKCGEIIVAQTTIPLVAHTETSVAAVEATCTGTGLTAGTKCSICNKTLVAQQETPKVAHTYDDKYDENCNSCGFIRDAECAHRETETIYGYAASCTAAGLSDGTKCKKCGVVIVSQNVLQKSDHIESGWIIDKEATSTSNGNKHIECIVCGKIIYSSIIPQTGLSQAEITAKLKSSVVKVICYDYDEKTELSQGTGFFIDNQGTFITNAHVIEGSYYIKIETYLGATYDVDIICKYNYTYSDYAICKVKNYFSTPVEFCSSAQVGDTVYALGYPNDAFIMSTSSGVITSTDAMDGTKHFYVNTARIDHGSSGGILADSQGRVLGITTGIFGAGEYAALKYQDFKFDADGIHITGKEPVEYFHKVTEYNFNSYSMSKYFEIYVEVISHTDTRVYYRVGVRLKEQYQGAKIKLETYGSARINIELVTEYDYYEVKSYGTYHQNKTTTDTIYLYFYSVDDLKSGKTAMSTSSIYISTLNDYYNMKISYEADFDSLQSGKIIIYD